MSEEKKSRIDEITLKDVCVFASRRDAAIALKKGRTNGTRIQEFKKVAREFRDKYVLTTNEAIQILNCFPEEWSELFGEEVCV